MRSHTSKSTMSQKFQSHKKNFIHYSKNVNRKNRKIDFSFHSALYPSFMRMGSKLMEGEGVCISLLGTGPSRTLVMQVKCIALEAQESHVWPARHPSSTVAFFFLLRQPSKTVIHLNFQPIQLNKGSNESLKATSYLSHHLPNLLRNYFDLELRWHN